ncbi:MAG: TrkH family potassium uptake protein [Planctomycetes bacterium]|nr:TrkH family potassium uptake protein [Planctomycetota bacterium]
MNPAQIARMLAGFATFFTIAQLPPLVVALQEPNDGRFATAAGFLASIALGAVVALLLRLGSRGDHGAIFRKEAIAVAGLSWVLAGLLGAVPFQWSGLLPSAADAVFETVSGLTTTGASVLGTGANPPVLEAPPSLLLWRALLQWIGGIGIILVFVALLPAMGVTGKNLLTSESVGVATQSFQPRAIEKARVIGLIYAALTAGCAMLLVWVGGFSWFEAICHAFSALATGGFSTRESIAAFDSLGGEIVLTVAMFLAGGSFAFLAAHWRGGWQTVRHLARSGEFRMYTLSTAVVVGVCTLALCRAGMPFGPALRQASFNGVSVLTSTGYATSDFQAWPTMALLVLFSAMLVGGCSGSTAGGMKQVRLLVILKLLGYTIRQFVRPKIVERIKIDNEPLPAIVISSALAIALMWLLTICAGAFVLSFDERFSFIGALSASATMVCNCGPAFSTVDPATIAQALTPGGVAATLAGEPNFGPFGGYGGLSAWTKAVMTAQMLLGRLELLTLLALFSPNFWRR